MATTIQNASFVPDYSEDATKTGESKLNQLPEGIQSTHSDETIARLLDILSSHVAQQGAINAELLKAKQEEKDDTLSSGPLSRSTMNALARGQFININVAFDRDISKLRVATSFKQKDFSKPREPDEMNFMDYILALSKLSTLYSEFGQTNIGLQTVKLITAALVESASKTRKSIIAACERVRRTTTHPGCSWNSDSLASAESRAILVQLPIPRNSQTNGSIR